MSGATSAPRLARWVLVALPGAATVWLSFQAGGFFAATVAVSALAMVLALLIRVMSVDAPFAGLGALALTGSVALALFGVWVLLSSIWSDSAARAILEYDRALLYLAALVLFGSVAWADRELRWMVRLLTLGLLVVCVVAFLARTVPELWSSPPEEDLNRLSYPLTYWNALGLLAALAAVLALALTSDGREHAAVRAAAAAAPPVAASVLLLTLSRGAIAAAVLGVLVLILPAVNRSLLPGLIATVPPTAAAAIVTYRSDLLGGDPPPAVLAAAGHDVAVAVLACVAAAVVLRIVLTPLDNVLGRIRWRPRRGPVLATGAAALTLAAVVLIVGLDAPDRLSTQYERFADAGTVEAGGGRDRLGEAGSNHRVAIWRVALDSFQEEPLTGHGAGTFELTWAQERPITYRVSEGHSLYTEVLSELGLVGAVLVAAVLLVLLAGVALRTRGEQRVLYAGLLAALVTWAFHAGVDLDWEMTAVTLWVFALGGAALSRRRDGEGSRPRRPLRVAVGVGLLLVALLPALVFASQTRFDAALEAFRQGDCPGAIEASLDSLSALRARPEPFQVIGYCDARLGELALAQRAMRASVRRDPENWATHYGLAVVTAAAGRDPRPAAAAAARLNPRTRFTRRLVRRFDTDDSREWTRRARGARLVIR